MTMQRRFFLRRARRYLLLMLVPTVLLLGIYVYSAVKAQETTLETEGQVTMSTVTEYCGLTVDHVLDQNDMLSGTTRVLMVLRRMLFSAKMSYSDSTIFNMLKTTMTSLVNSDDAVDSIFYWLDDSPRVFTTEGSGIVLLDSMADTGWLEVYRSLGREERLRIYANRADERSPRITAVVRMLLKGGCFVIHLDAEALEKKLAPMLHREEEQLLLLNTEGELLLSVSNGGGLLSLSEDEILGLMSAEAGTWVTLQGSRYLYETGQEGHFRVMTLVPQSVLYGRVLGILRSFLWVLAADVLVVAVLSWLVTRRTTRRLHRLLEMFDQALHGLPIEKPEDTGRDEYDLIMNNIAYMYLRDTTLQSKMKEETLRKENAELMALQLQINPHFLYNTLQTMDFAILAGKADRQDISDAFHDLSAILRYALSNPQQPVTLGQELEKLRSYADIQRFRFGDRFVLYIEVEEELERARVFRMLLQPLVENSMLHGLNGLKERGHIWVRAERVGERLEISVQDTGTGMTEEERQELLRRINDQESRSIGLTNLNRRLLLHYGPESGLRIASAPGEGTTVSFTIPYERDEA